MPENMQHFVMGSNVKMLITPFVFINVTTVIKRKHMLSLPMSVSLKNMFISTFINNININNYIRTVFHGEYCVPGIISIVE